MTKPDKDKLTTTDGVDPTISAQYRRLAADPAPDALNQAVLRAARREVRRNSNGFWQSDWFRPTAFIAMVALSFALILEMNDANILPTHYLTSEQTRPSGNRVNVFQDAADAAARQIRDAEESASTAIQNSGAEVPSSIDTKAAADQATLSPGDRNCDARQRSTMASWWQCIEALESGGASVAAERELTALMSAFPGFVIPEGQPDD